MASQRLSAVLQRVFPRTPQSWRAPAFDQARAAVEGTGLRITSLTQKGVLVLRADGPMQSHAAFRAKQDLLSVPGIAEVRIRHSDGPV